VPELPEAETIRRQLEGAVTGARITGVTVNLPRMVRVHSSPAEFVALVKGRRIERVDRRGKALILTLAGPKTPVTLVIHLGMSGVLLVREPGARRDEYDHVVFALDDGRELRFLDVRQFGEAAAWPTGNWAEIPDLAKYGLEPLSAEFTLERLTDLLSRRSTRLKAVLMDQEAIAGIGNIYGDEICFEARINPERPASGLTRPERERLLEAIPTVLRRAIECCGTSTADETYTDIYGNLGQFQNMLAVYGRTGLPCRVCGTPIRRSVWQKRGLHYCPKCQPRRRMTARKKAAVKR
jgi:formamidopyrimidine-DNA glycosylase